MSWASLAIVGLIACAVLYTSEQPNQRRKRKNSKYSGPERREDNSNQADFFQCPVFRVPYYHINKKE